MTYPPADYGPYEQQQSGLAAPTPPTRRNRWLAFALGWGGIAAIAVFVVLRLTLGGSSPDTVVDKAVAAINNRDAAQARQLSCAKSSADITNLQGNFAGVRVSTALSRAGDVTENGDAAQAPITVKFTATVMGNTISRSGRSTMKLRKQDGDWCVDDLTAPLGLTGN